MLYINSAYTQIKTSTHHPIHPQTLCLKRRPIQIVLLLFLSFQRKRKQNTHYVRCYHILEQGKNTDGKQSNEGAAFNYSNFNLDLK